ncbi:DUF4222 domain-containing protein [Escherichia coli]|uniref:DUF4222 domain-containing protein n=1 Tax=Escherichia coli TaxID=562 RepID=UPI000C1C7858|nr:DUF4222 domain-containing protein [Escherichia coli]
MPFYFRKECPLNSGYLNAHPKIIPGAIYLDKNGNRVTVKELMFDRVYFIRDGYSFHSSLNVEIFISRFRREIPPSRNNHVPCMDVDKKLQELKNMIAAWREQK